MFNQTDYFQPPGRNFTNEPIPHFSEISSTSNDSLPLYQPLQHINSSTLSFSQSYHHHPHHESEMIESKYIAQQETQPEVYSVSSEPWTPCESLEMGYPQIPKWQEDTFTTNAAIPPSEYPLFDQKPGFSGYTSAPASADEYTFHPLPPQPTSEAFYLVNDDRQKLVKPDPIYGPSLICAGFGQPSLSEYQANTNTKPPFSYITLIVSAMMSHSGKRATLNEIYSWIMYHFVYYQSNTKRWQNSIRHALSFNDCFMKVPRPTGETGKGSYWTLHSGAIGMFDNGSSIRRNRKFVDEQRSRQRLERRAKYLNKSEHHSEPARISSSSRVFTGLISDDLLTTPETAYYDQYPRSLM